MIQINELVMRVPGISEQDGSVLGNEVAQLVAKNLPDDMEGHQIPELKIQMSASPSNGSMASAIAEQIIYQINRAVYNT